jgi:nucleotide-binding universal stress UspA family protein
MPESIARQSPATSSGPGIRIDRVLCAVDFSENSERALEYAGAIARWYRARLTIAHVHTAPPVLELAAETEDAVQRDRVLGRLQDFVASLPPGLHTQLRAVAGAPPGRLIAALAADIRADLVVVGSHGRSRLERLMMGSVSESVVRLSPCPTLVVPQRAADAPDEAVEFRRILCPVDFSDASLRALEYALTLSEEMSAELTVLHVQDAAPDRLPAAVSSAYTADQLDADRRRIDRLIPDEVKRYCTVDALVRQGPVHRQIVAAAVERRADLITMGYHGHGELDAMMFGSNTASVVREATCPVLIVTRR